MTAPNLTRDQARARAETINVGHYAIDLDLTDGNGAPGEKTFASSTTVTFTGATEFVSLQTSYDPAQPFVLASAVMLLLGLIAFIAVVDRASTP